jgi:methionine synthase I (cobalamin-dependent)
MNLTIKPNGKHRIEEYLIEKTVHAIRTKGRRIAAKIVTEVSNQGSRRKFPIG